MIRPPRHFRGVFDHFKEHPPIIRSAVREAPAVPHRGNGMRADFWRGFYNARGLGAPTSPARAAWLAGRWWAESGKDPLAPDA